MKALHNIAAHVALRMFLFGSSLSVVACGEEITRVCVVTPGVEMGAQSLAIAPGLQSTLVRYLLKPEVAAVPVSGHSDDQLRAEAERGRCNFLLYSQILQGKKPKHVGRKFANFAIQMASPVPMSV